ncbi:hypothetical protein AVEN_71625-1 [Araneus ventricosus]|uniref:Uncharacterized protein n=1 Tax=Araneus ventricosus TaxID=182803 RepID=A0A4Y2GEA8_ARAVE|nr:hypothetical protein AVEN_71625-1 [Araneus ventricosus]
MPNRYLSDGISGNTVVKIKLEGIEEGLVQENPSPLGLCVTTKCNHLIPLTWYASHVEIQGICFGRIEIIRLIAKILVILQALCNKPGSNLPGGLQNDQSLCNNPGSNLPIGLQNDQSLCNNPGSNLLGGLQTDQSLCNKPGGLQTDQSLCNMPGGLQNDQSLCNKPGSNLPSGLQNDQALCNRLDYLNSPTTYTYMLQVSHICSELYDISQEFYSR